MRGAGLPSASVVRLPHLVRLSCRILAMALRTSAAGLAPHGRGVA
jgi:hypothetical protein